MKRVVGLPGERIRIDDGELFVDGQLVRKSLAEQRAVRILVQDSAFVADEAVAHPWQAEADNTAWQSDEHGYVRESLAASNDETASIDWLTFRNYQRGAHDPTELEESPIYDDYGYNQGLVRRLNVVGDLALVADVLLRGAGEFALLATDGREDFLVKIDLVSTHGDLFHNGRPVADFDVEPLGGRDLEIEFSLCDRRVLLAVDGRVVLDHAFEVSDRTRRPTSRPFALGARGLAVEVRRCRVYRDIYLTSDDGRSGTWPHGIDEAYTVGADALFLLGDNSPVSQDSRSGEVGGISRTQVLGKPLRVLGLR